MEPTSLDGWVLQDEALTLPVKARMELLSSSIIFYHVLSMSKSQEQLDEKSVAALVLQEGAEVEQEELTAQPTLRLNSHLMELSMKARCQLQAQR